MILCFFDGVDKVLGREYEVDSTEWDKVTVSADFDKFSVSYNSVLILCLDFK